MTQWFEKYVDLGSDSPDWGPNSTLIHSRTMEKVASECYTPESLLRIADTLKPRDEGVYVLLNALGAYETWGANRNADAFPRWSLKSEPTPARVRSLLTPELAKRGITYKDPDPSLYGTRTFETNAHVFSGHNNQDPKLSIGDVIAAAYNDKMDRAELIVFVYRDKHPETVKQLEEGYPVPWSMGSRLPFDSCSICGNVAKRRDEYCTHMKDMPRMILGDGRQVFSYNYYPRFFDISRVRTPADPSAWTLRKIAQEGGSVEKQAVLEKRVVTNQSEEVAPSTADPKTTAFIRTKLRDDIARQKALPKSTLDKMKSKGMSKAASSAAALGIYLKDAELDYLCDGDRSKLSMIKVAEVDAELVYELGRFCPTRSMMLRHFEKRAKLRSDSTLTNEDRLFAGLLDDPTIKSLANYIDQDPAVKLASDRDAFARSISSNQQQYAWLPFVLATKL